MTPDGPIRPMRPAVNPPPKPDRLGLAIGIVAAVIAVVCVFDVWLRIMLGH